MTNTFTFETSKKKPSPRSQAALRFARALRKDGFLPRTHFIERISERALGGGIRFDPRTFRSEFDRAAHYRQTRPGYKMRIAVVRGVPILYRVGGRSGKQIVLGGALPPGSDLPPNERISAPRQKETESESEGLLEEIEQESVGSISETDYIKWVQRSLNRLHGAAIPTDGAISGVYRSALRRFNRDYTGREYDGVDETTQNQIIYANEGNGAYVAWVILALNAAGFGPFAITETYTPAVVAAIKKFQARPGLGIKSDGYVGSKTELALIKASGLIPPGELKKKVRPPRYDRRKLARRLLDLSRELTGAKTIREKRILCILRLLTSHLVDGERIDDCFVDTSPPFGKLRCRERALQRLARRNPEESFARFRKAIFDLYDEIKQPLERTKLALIKISADTTSDVLVNTPECTFVRFFKKKARDRQSIYHCFSTYIASLGSQCDLR